MPEIGPGLGPYIEKQKASLKVDGKITYTVIRKDEAGAAKEVTLEAPVIKIERKKKHVLELNPNATAEQLALREAWLSDKK
jgi:hypothetical protein